MIQNNTLKYFINAAAILVAVMVFVTCKKDKEEGADASGKTPAKAMVTGEAENTCPSTTVVLTAAADGAQSFLWYRNTFAIADATASTYAATSGGVYYAVGVNAAGQGEKSEGKEVHIYFTCPPSTPVLEGSASNACPSLIVRLTAAAGNAESYTWYKGTDTIDGVTGAFYDVRESGVYTVAAHNAYGASVKSEGKTVTIAQCPPAAPAISGNTANVCPETTVTLTASSPGADSYQWYRYNELIPGATASTYRVTTTGGYYAAAVNSIGTGAKTSNAHLVYIDLCSANYTYTDLLGTYNATGTPCMLPEPGVSAWTSTITQGSTTAEYVVKPFADFATPTESAPPFYITVGRSDDNATVAFAVSTRRPLGEEEHVNEVTGLTQTYTAYFEAFFTHTEGATRYVHWFSNDYYQAFWDAATKTLDFSGVYTFEGVDYEIIVAIVARTSNDFENKRWEGAFSDGYKNCKFVQKGASGAPGAFTGERVALPKVGGQTPGASSLKSVTIDFDPTKFSRKR